ncbi:MAG: MFS transporter [Bryobacteraceae bacterium]
MRGRNSSADQPARAALMSSLVPKKDLLNAVSLQSAVFNSASVLGPALAGITVDRVGLPANFFLNALSFVAVLTSLLVIRPPKSVAANGKFTLLTQVREALVTVKRDTVLPWLLLSYGILLFSGPSLPLLLPILAVRNLRIGASTLGFLFSAAGIGAVLGALFLASLSDAHKKSVLLFGAFALWASSLIFIGFSRTMVITFVALVFFGMSQSIIGAITSTVLQTRVGHQMRGRVMSLNTLLIMGVRPLGDFPAGALISLWGAPFTAAASAILVSVTVLSLLFRRPALRTL